MPPTNPWGKKKPQEPNASSPGLPGVKSNSPAAQKSQYEEIQEDELIALSSIYGEDFHQIEKNQAAWKVY
jgi:translation initiation factor 2-alpha kinase 4